MITTKKGQPITGSTKFMQPRPPVLSDAAHTSSDAQKLVRRPPMPFENPDGPVNVSTRRIDNKKIGEFFERPGPVNAKPSSIGTRVGCANTSLTAEEMAAIGYGPKDTTSKEPIISGRPLQNRQNTIGPGSFPRTTGGNGQNTRRGNQAVPARETGARSGDYHGTRNNMRMPDGPMYTQGKPGARAHGSATAGRSTKKGEAPFYGQRP